MLLFKHKTAYEMRISDWSSDVWSSDRPGVVGIDAHPRQLDPLVFLFRRLGRALCRARLCERDARGRAARQRLSARGAECAASRTPSSGQSALPVQHAERRGEHTSELKSLMRITSS